VRPRDMLAPPDAPPTIEERVFPVDTLVDLGRSRTFMFLARAITVETPDGTTRLGVPSSVWSDADRLVSTMDQRHEALREEGVRQAQLRQRAAAEWQQAQERMRQPRVYTVRRGDALGSIATQWNTTTDQLRRWNNLPGIGIRVGQTLVVRP
jgi:hypothetical protein